MSKKEGKKMQIIYKKIEELKPYDNNPRNNAKAIPKVMESIEQFGFRNPIIIDKKNVIVCGHTRYEAGKRLGLIEIPCIMVDDLTPAQIKAFRIADNKVAEYSEWNQELLDIELEDLASLEFDMSGFGFDLVSQEESNVIEDDYDVDENVPEEPKSRLGDVYQLGNHRLMCGDSTKPDDVYKLMQGEIADLLYTDPPYNVNVENSDGLTIENDNMESSAFREFLSSAFFCASQNLKDGGSFYIWHGDSERVTFQETAEENALSVKQCLIWVKNSFNFGRQDYKWQHEPCLYGWKTGAGHYFIEEYNHPTVIEQELDIDKLKKEEMRAILKEIWDNKPQTTIIHENKPVKNDLHPTMKPLKLCGDMIRNSSKENEIVLDLFGGSGSTLMACEQLGRQCRMMEYDPRYVDVIINRWEEFTGEKAVKIS